MGQLFYWVANWNLSRAEAALRLGGHVDDMADATHSSVGHIAAARPAIRKFAGYVTGSSDIQWTSPDWSAFGAECSLVKIDQSPSLGTIADVGDLEAGAGTPGSAIAAAKRHLANGRDYTVYLSQAILTAVEDAAAAAGLPAGKIIAYQYASPTSNPNTLLPGTGLTLKEANADLSVTVPSWHPIPQPQPKPKPHHLARARLTADLQLDTERLAWTLEKGTVAPLPWGDQ